MICSRYDVATVPFPFVDRLKTKKRPAVVLSNKEFNRVQILLSPKRITFLDRITGWTRFFVSC